MAKKQDLLSDLLTEIETFLARSEMNESSFGHRTVNDGNLVKRLRSGGTVTLRTADRIRQFITEECSKPRRRVA